MNERPALSRQLGVSMSATEYFTILVHGVVFYNGHVDNFFSTTIIIIQYFKNQLLNEVV